MSEIVGVQRWKLEVLTGNNQRMYAASFQRKSANDKLSKVLKKQHANGRFQTFPQPPFVCSTYVSIAATCPDECTFKGAGCYVQGGNASGPMKRLDEGARLSNEHPNVLEARLIDRQWSPDYHYTMGVPQDGAQGGRDTRLHVGGDVLDTMGAKVLAAACVRLRQRGGGKIWTYTHRWRDVPIEAWGPAISALASVETSKDAEEAIELGYTPAFTVSQFASKRVYELNGIRITPCPALTRGVKCINCRMCFKPLPKGGAIGFAWHGRSKVGKRRLEVIQKEELGQLRMGLR